MAMYYVLYCSLLTFLCVVVFVCTEVNAYRLELEGITVKGKGCPKPIKTWVQCGVSMKILNALKKWVLMFITADVMDFGIFVGTV